MATGGLFVVAGAAAACNVEPAFLDVPDARVAAVVPVAAVGLGTVTTMAAAPRRPAAPAPRVMADAQASLLLRASCRGEPGVGELVMVLQSRFGGVLRRSCSMRSRSNTRLCGLSVLPLTCL